MTESHYDGELRLVALADIRASKTNPRKNFDPAKLEELAESIRTQGLVQPVVVRRLEPHRDGKYELVAGERRTRAAKLAGLVTVPAIVREMTDAQALEAQVIENLQRADLHPLEEASGYQLLAARGLVIATIAERLGRSVKYVYDRIKLLELTKAAQQLFLDGRINAGHAILLARLSAADQAKAIALPNGGVWQHQYLLHEPDAKREAEDSYKAKSVRELEAWIDENVRFAAKTAAKADPMLFPETVATVEAAAAAGDKIIPITHDWHVPPHAKGDEARTWGPQSWKRADGDRGSKPCEYSVTGVIAIGAGRSEAFKVCVNKDKCKAHWGDVIRAREKRAKQAAAGSSSKKPAVDPYERQREMDRQAQARSEAARERWKKAVPAILEAVAERVKKVPAGAAGLLGQILLGQVTPYGGVGAVGDLVPRGRTAEDLVRHAVFLLLAGEACEWAGHDRFPKTAKAFGVDALKIMAKVAPPPKPAKAAAAASKAPKPAGRKKGARRAA